MLTGLPPFYNSSDREQMFKDIMQTEVMFPPYLSPEAQSLIQHLLCKDPAMRLGGSSRDAEEVKAHAFFQSMDWDLLLRRQLVPPFVPSLDSEFDTKYVESVHYKQEFTLAPAVDSSSNEPRFATSPTYQGFTYQGSPIKEGHIS
jgi:serine/threonine protein kinase